MTVEVLKKTLEGLCTNATEPVACTGIVPTTATSVTEFLIDSQQEFDRLQGFIKDIEDEISFVTLLDAYVCMIIILT